MQPGRWMSKRSISARPSARRHPSLLLGAFYHVLSADSQATLQRNMLVLLVDRQLQRLFSYCGHLWILMDRLSP